MNTISAQKIFQMASVAILALLFSGIFFVPFTTHAQNTSAENDGNVQDCNGDGPCNDYSARPAADRVLPDSLLTPTPTPTPASAPDVGGASAEPTGGDVNAPNRTTSGGDSPDRNRPGGDSPDRSRSGGSENLGTGKISNPLKVTSIEELLLKIIDIILVFVLPLIILYIMYAGYLFVSAAGNTEQISTAKTALLWAVVGGVIVLGAKIILEVIKGTVSAL